MNMSCHTAVHRARWWRPLLLGALALAGMARAADEGKYTIQPGDVLQVSVWRETELQAEVLVRPDGGISFPLAGDLQVSGMATADVADAIAARIKRFIPDPLVTVATKLISGNRIYVVGKVNRPGEFTMNRPIDVMQAIGMAAGATPFADLSAVRVLRRENGQQSAIRFDYKDVERGRSLEQNIVLKSGDTVVVP
jgi:polysaccharide export outer membrane protein